jgi:hypothetical protein
VHRKHYSVAYSMGFSIGIFLAVSGVGPVLISDIFLVATISVISMTSSCLIYPWKINGAFIFFSSFYPYFLSFCSDTLQSSQFLGGFPCLLQPGTGISALMVGVPGAIIYGLPLWAISYIIGERLFDWINQTGVVP